MSKIKKILTVLVAAFLVLFHFSPLWALFSIYFQNNIDISSPLPHIYQSSCSFLLDGTKSCLKAPLDSVAFLWSRILVASMQVRWIIRKLEATNLKQRCTDTNVTDRSSIMSSSIKLKHIIDSVYEASVIVDYQSTTLKVWVEGFIYSFETRRDHLTKTPCLVLRI